MNEMITSRANRSIVEAVKLKDRKVRDELSLFYFEGKKLLAEALRTGTRLEKIFTAPASSLPGAGIDPEIVFPVSDSVYAKLSDENSPEGIFCIAEKPAIHKEFKNEKPLGKIFIISSIRDPGNVGTILRTAAAFSVGTVILSSDCADIFNPKTIRASMGAVFRQSTLRTDNLPDAIISLSDRYEVYAAALSEDALPLGGITIGENTAFVVGNEGHGLDSDVLAVCRGRVIIPISAETESLNASVAAAILMWELSRSGH